MATFRHGKSTVIKLGDSSNALQDVSQYFDTIGLPRAIANDETTAFGLSDKTFIVGLRDNKISLKGTFDATIDAQIDGCINALNAGTFAALTWQYGPAGSTSGFPRYSGVYVVGDYQIDGAVGATVKTTVNLQISGVVTRDTWP